MFVPFQSVHVDPHKLLRTSRFVRDTTMTDKVDVAVIGAGKVLHSASILARD